MVGAVPNWAGVLNMGSGASPEGCGGGGGCSGGGEPVAITNCPCSVCCDISNPNCGGIDPPPPTGVSQTVTVDISHGGITVSGMDVYSVNSGETKSSTCGSITFYHKVGGIKQYIAGPVGTLCTMGSAQVIAIATNSMMTPLPVEIVL